MLSNKPYLIRAFHEWIVDSNCTPYLLVNAMYPHCKVPQDYIENGEITLNIAPHAIRDLSIKNDFIDFQASFSGVVYTISVPVKAVLAIYAHENQQGMFFDYEESDDSITTMSSEVPPSQQETKQDKTRVSHLRLVD